jgi:hypothetical protein
VNISLTFQSDRQAQICYTINNVKYTAPATVSVGQSNIVVKQTQNATTSGNSNQVFKFTFQLTPAQTGLMTCSAQADTGFKINCNLKRR